MGEPLNDFKKDENGRLIKRATIDWKNENAASWTNAGAMRQLLGNTMGEDGWKRGEQETGNDRVLTDRLLANDDRRMRQNSGAITYWVRLIE